MGDTGKGKALELVDAPESRHPFDTTNIFSILSLHWVTTLIIKGFKKGGRLDPEDVWLPAHDEDCRTSAAAFEETIRRQLAATGQIDTKKALFMTFKKPMLISALCMVVYLFVLCIGSFYFLYELLTWAAEPHATRGQWRGWLWATLLVLNAVLTTFSIQLQFFFALKAGVQMRGAIMATVYRKALRISTVKSVGQVVNLVSNDVQRLFELCQWLNFGWAGPVSLVVVTILCAIRIGWPAVPGLALIVILFATQFYVGKRTQELRRQAISVTDKRVRHMSEILTSIKMIKLYAWENSFSQSIAKIRHIEIDFLRSVSLWKSLNFSLFFAAANISVLLIFAINYWRGHSLSARAAFVIVALLNTLRFPIVQMPVAIKAWVDTTVTCNRLNEFLSSKEVDQKQGDTSQKSDAEGRAISFRQASFRWDTAESDAPTLQDVNMQVRVGELVGVCGAVGAGKSTLLSAILSQVTRTGGEVAAYGRVSFVAQQPWILNMSLRDNILFGAAVDEEKYQRVLDACCLLPDLAILPAGDKTEIGERGINLSGGQKARISLARAVYNNADVYLLDDPLSAVDQHVGKRLFHECITGLLKGKTVVLVTHQLQYLSQCNQVVFMVRGQVAGSGTYDRLQETNAEFRRLIDQHVGEQEQQSKEGDQAVAKPAAKQAAGTSKGPGGAGGLVLTEEQSLGGLGLYAAYADYAGGILPVLLAFGLFFITQVFNSYSSYWVSVWSANKLGLEQGQYLYILTVLTAFFVGTSVVRGFYFVYVTLRAAQRIHNSVFSRVLLAPMFFFDSTPLGRILNRFSKDQEQIDDALPDALLNTVMYSFVIFATLVLIAILFPIFLALVAPMCVLYMLLSYLYMGPNASIKSLEGVSRSPVFAHLSATLQGLSSIRAYRVEERFIADANAKINRTNSFFFHFWALGRWLALRLDLIAAAIIMSVAYYGIIANLDPGTYGLLMSQALAMTGIFQWCVRALNDVQANATSVERQLYYLNQLPAEPPRKLPGNEPPPNWPTAGAVEFDRVTMKYREGLDPVLQDVSFSVRAGEKIGIVGRTGAGKSTISLALFHMILHVSGSIKIDGVDVFQIGLDDLRSRLAVIPQDPVLFVGSMRHNLDPHHAYTDEELWQALERVNLKDFVAAQPQKLDMDVTENGENLSVGQRQLVCIARCGDQLSSALLRKSKILFLDEATAAVDMATDQLIQTTLRTSFNACTVFAIAHRLNTIIDYDKVLVMEAGRVAEFAAPAALLANPESKFSKLVAETGKSMAKHLTKAAISRKDVMLEPIQAVKKEKKHKKNKERVENPAG